MKRRLLKILSALSLALSVALALLWVSARDSYECLSLSHDGWPTPTVQRNNSIRLGVSGGRLVLYTHTVSTDYSNLSERNLTPQVFERIYQRGRATGVHWHSWRGRAIDVGTLGFGAEHITMPQVAGQGGAVDCRIWSLPVAPPIALLCVPPALWLRRTHRIERRSRLGLCLSCGYDLRASKERCPECGTPIPHNSSEDAAPSRPI